MYKVIEMTKKVQVFNYFEVNNLLSAWVEKRKLETITSLLTIATTISKAFETGDSE